LLIQGRQFKRLDGNVGLRVNTNNGWITVPCTYHGFPQRPEDFDVVVGVGEYSSKHLNNIYARAGLGVPTVIVRCGANPGDFQRKKGAFPATVVLRPVRNAESVAEGPFALEFYNPLRVSSVVVQEISVPLACDKSAAIARALNTTNRTYVQNFLQPDFLKPDEKGLFMIEPYQPGKIPVVFVHGLLSDRLTWANLVNEIQACPELINRFQIWGFEYPTGESFLTSAAMLRRQLVELRCQIDPGKIDEALMNTVLVGHSMGGLISKMQITESRDVVWNSISTKNFEEIDFEPGLREQFADAVFFEPSPMVSRVVYIGTPHQGSELARRTIGRLASLLVREPPSVRIAHQELIQDNPNAFSREFSRRVPTSIDLLDPNSPLLLAINRLPVEQRVETHSVVGYGRWMLKAGDSDGIVPVSSAQLASAISESKVHEKHVNLTKNPLAIDEVMCILNAHTRTTYVE